MAVVILPTRGSWSASQRTTGRHPAPRLCLRLQTLSPVWISRLFYPYFYLITPIAEVMDIPWQTHKRCCAPHVRMLFPERSSDSTEPLGVEYKWSMPTCRMFSRVESSPALTGTSSKRVSIQNCGCLRHSPNGRLRSV